MVTVADTALLERVTECDPVQPLASVATNVYVPSPKPVCVNAVVVLLLSLYVLAPVPPLTVNVMDPSEPPSHVGADDDDDPTVTAVGCVSTIL